MNYEITNNILITCVTISDVSILVDKIINNIINLATYIRTTFWRSTRRVFVRAVFDRKGF